MKIDIHCHVLGNGKDINNVNHDVFFKPDDNQLLFTRLLANLVEGDLRRMEGDLNRDGIISTFEYFEILFKMLKDSQEIDGLVLLGMDAVYSADSHALDEIKTNLWVSNRFLSEKVIQLNTRLANEGILNKRFYFGASVSSNRSDWESELDFVINQTDAVLIKWIPSTQHIMVNDEGHRCFYNKLASNNIPLLCHVGPEYAFPEGIRNKKLDSFKHLKMPLDCGVTVIAAHCAAPVFPIFDPNYIKDFYALMEDANSGGQIKLWADTSGLTLSTRLPYISEILETFPVEWLVNGSDFPLPVDGWHHLPFITNGITPKEYIQICKTKNPLDKDIRIKRAHGFSDSIIENAKRVLRLTH